MKISILQEYEVSIVHDMLLLMGLIGGSNHCRLCIGNDRIAIASNQDIILLSGGRVYTIIGRQEYISNLLEIDIDKYLINRGLEKGDTYDKHIYLKIYQVCRPILDRLGSNWYIDIVRPIKCLSSSEYINLVSEYDIG